MYAQIQNINSEQDVDLKQRLILTIDSIPYATAIWVLRFDLCH